MVQSLHFRVKCRKEITFLKRYPWTNAVLLQLVTVHKASATDDGMYWNFYSVLFKIGGQIWHKNLRKRTDGAGRATPSVRKSHLYHNNKPVMSFSQGS